MKNTATLIVLVGALGILASLYNMINTNEIVSNLSGLVCGGCLIWGYFELKREKKDIV